MNIDELIQKLSLYKKDSNKEKEKEVVDSYQVDFLEGKAGSIINKISDRYEIYMYLKNKNNIVSPLLLWKTDSEEKAIDYFKRLNSIIDSQDYNIIIGFCESGL